MRHLGGRYVPRGRPGRQGARGDKGDPGVTTQPKEDGSLEIAPTDPVGPAAVALPAPPAIGTYTPTVIDGVVTWQETTP